MMAWQKSTSLRNYEADPKILKVSSYSQKSEFFFVVIVERKIQLEKKLVGGGVALEGSTATSVLSIYNLDSLTHCPIKSQTLIILT